MKPRCSVYIAASVDGYIARPDGDVEWLERAGAETADGESDRSADRGAGPRELTYDEFIGTVDALVMGRNTFEKVLTFGFWPYGTLPVVVLTSRPMEIPTHLPGTVSTESGEPDHVVARLGTHGYSHLYVDGGATIQRFLRAGLIEEITVTWIPVLLGEGIALFGSFGRETWLRHLAAVPYGNGFVQCRYRVMSEE